MTPVDVGHRWGFLVLSLFLSDFSLICSIFCRSSLCLYLLWPLTVFVSASISRCNVTTGLNPQEPMDAEHCIGILHLFLFFFCFVKSTRGAPSAHRPSATGLSSNPKMRGRRSKRVGENNDAATGRLACHSSNSISASSAPMSSVWSSKSRVPLLTSVW